VSLEVRVVTSYSLQMLTRVPATQETYVLLTGRSAEQVTELEGCGLFLHPWQIPCKCHCLNRKIGQVEDHQNALSVVSPAPDRTRIGDTTILLSLCKHVVSEDTECEDDASGAHQTPKGKYFYPSAKEDLIERNCQHGN